MSTNLRHKGLKTHPLKSIRGVNGSKLFEAYAENKTPGAYRIIWQYGPKRQELTIQSIIPHPDNH